MASRFRLILGFILAGPVVRAVDKVPDFDVTDSYATSPTMLVRLGIDSQVREIWTGMDAEHQRHVPLFLETSLYGLVREKGGAWVDLRTLKYLRTGTRPGIVVLHSEDGQVEIEATSVRNSGACPLFVTYNFKDPVDFRLTAAFKYPQFITSSKVADEIGAWTYSPLWRNENPILTTVPGGPALILATLPSGKTLDLGPGQKVKEIGNVRQVELCIDATGAARAPQAGESYAQAWLRRLGRSGDTEAQFIPNRVTLATEDARLDRLFEASVDAVASSQFASGDVMGDMFFYRDSWLRDGSYSIIGLALAGDHAAAERYFGFWDAQRDFSVGGEREAQQPSIAITAMWLYSRLCSDAPEFMGRVWPYVKYYGDYYARRIAREGMLSVSEEWICFIPSATSWPNAEIYSGMRAAAKIALRTGHPGDAGRWNAAADTLKATFSAQAYDAKLGRIIPMAGAEGQVFTDPEFPKAESRNGPLRDGRVDGGMLIIGRFEALGKGQGVIDIDDPRFTSTQAEIMRDLEHPDHSIFRFGPNPTSPHAPQGELDNWPIIGAWAAQDEWLMGQTDLAWRYILSGIVNKDSYDLEKGCFYLPENWDQKGFTDKPLITWSHGEFVTTSLLLFLGFDLEPVGADLGLAPSLPPGMKHAHIGNFSFRDWSLDIDLTRRDGLVEVVVAAANAASPGSSLSIRTPSGKVVMVTSGSNARFTADPASYPLAFGRTHNAYERAAVVQAVLKPSPPPADLRSLSPAGLEDFIRRTETEFVPTAK